MRQSTVTTFAHCPMSALFEIQAGQRHATPLARGTLAHRCQEEILRTLKKQGEDSMPTEEGIVIMREVLAQIDTPSEDVLVLPAEEEAALRQFVIRFCAEWKWNAKQVMGLEVPLSAEITCPDGIVRVLTGTPDVLVAEPPDTIVVVDAKSGLGVPRTPRDPDPSEPRRYLTERGQGQLDAYGYLVMREWPVKRVKLREIHPRVGEERTATLERAELEHVEWRLGNLLMLLDRGLQEGPDSGIWKAVGGTRQCDWCIRKDLCPRPAMERGGITDLPMAMEYAQDAVALTAKREQVIKMVKGFVEAEEAPVPLPDGRVYGWSETEKDGKVSRKFCAHVPPEPVVDDTDWAGAFAGQAAANREARG